MRFEYHPSTGLTNGNLKYKRAGDEIRTHEWYLGKVLPYHLATPAFVKGLYEPRHLVVKDTAGYFQTSRFKSHPVRSFRILKSGWVPAALCKEVRAFA